jgi:hypothetical protein
MICEGHHDPHDPESLRRELNQAMFQKVILSAMDALVAFVPEGEEIPGKIKEAEDEVGESRWFPVPGGWKVRCPYVGQEFDRELFTIEEGGWEHTHCDRCSATISAGETCRISGDDDNRYIICEKCFAGLGKGGDV